MKHYFLRSIIATALLVGLAACGGGSSGGDDFIGAGRVSLEVSPTTIDVGDRMLATVRLEDAIEDGVQLKVRFPNGLGYVPESGSLSNSTQRERDSIDPDVNVETAGVVYLVFFLDTAVLDENGDGDIQFQLVGRDRVLEGQVAVDVDVDDPLIDNEIEFDLERPEFQVEASRNIAVLD
jgi:hypothetical protein